VIKALYIYTVGYNNNMCFVIAETP